MVKKFQFLILLFVCLLGISSVFVSKTEATVYMTRISDLLTTSGPGLETNQTIRFRLNQAIPANGAIEISFSEGGFSIPATLNFTDVDVSFGAPGGPYTDRPLSSVQTGGTDDITVTSGTTGKIRIDLNTSIGIPANNEVVVEVGTNATYGAIGDVRARLANATGTYPVTIRSYNTSDVELDFGRTVIVVVEQVGIGPVDTTDQTPPVILSANPTGILQVGTRAVEVFVETDERASCRYATSSMPYLSMPYSFSGTTTGLVYWHFAQISGLEDDTEYRYYLRCRDYRLNEIDPDYELYFRVGVAPGAASTTATTTGTGTGTGVSSTTVQGGPGTGDDVGTGGGPTGSGGGTSSTGGDTDGTSDSSTSGTDGGTKLPQADVRIDGWAYPSSVVSIMKDGVLLTTKSAGSGGEFSHLVEGLDRGSYTFAVYAVDAEKGRSASYATTLWLRSDTLNVLSNVMLPPTIHVAEASISPGDPLLVSGYTAPNAVVTTWLRPKLAEVSTADIVATTTAGSTGKWSLTISTAGLTQGTYELLAQGKMKDGLVESDKSARKTIGIGVTVADGDCLSIGDLNCDTFVNLVDFSILLFNWNTGASVADINKDGVVSLPDFSIMLFYWTG